MRRFTVRIFILSVMLITLGVMVFAAPNAREVQVFIDGTRVEFEDQQPIYMGSATRTIIPVRAVFEELGFNVEWYGPARRVILTRNNDIITMDVAEAVAAASNIVAVNGDIMPLGMPAMIFSDRTLIPIQGLLERIGHLYEWDDATRTMYITSLRDNISWDLIPSSLANQTNPPNAGEQFAIIYTNFGEIHLRLFPDLAPMAVENFVTLAQNGFYDDIIFHRVIEGFVVQGGCPFGTGAGGESIWGTPFGIETSPNLRHIRGALSMAYAGVDNPISNSSQFFIVQGDDLYYDFVPVFEQSMDMWYDLAEDGVHTLGELFPSEFEFIQHYLEYGGWPHLDFTHTVFGQVFIGMDIVDAIAVEQTDENDRPLMDVVIERIEILTMP